MLKSAVIYTKGADSIEFAYGTDHMRYKRTETIAGNTTISHYLGGGYERIQAANNEITHKYQIYANGNMVAVHIESDNPQVNQSTRYMHYDALGNIDLVTDGYGNSVELSSFDAFGKRRASLTQKIEEPTPDALLKLISRRGYTGHEHLDDFGLIHMNGRVYDPEIARFVSADPMVMVQAPYSTRSYNRYSYVWNNPLVMTDPSGYFSLKKLGNWLKKDGVKTIAIVAVTVYTGGAAAAWASGAGFGAVATGAIAGGAAGFVGGGLTTGTWEGAVQGALIGAATGAVGGYLGSSGLDKHLAQGLSGGMNGYLQTGNMGGFVRGFVAGQVPGDLGSESYYTNQYANFAVNRAREVIQGYMINGKEGARTNVIGGAMNDSVGHLIGAATAYANNRRLKGPNFREGMYFYDSGDAIGNFGADALTVGNVVSGPRYLYQGSTCSWLNTHEIAHYQNQSALGAYYLPVHMMSQWGGRLTGSKPFMEYKPFHSDGYETAY